MPDIPQPQTNRPGHRQARRSFWLLVAVAVLASGGLNAALLAPPSPLTGLSVAASGLILLTSLTLAARVMIALDQVRRRDRRTQMPQRRT